MLRIGLARMDLTEGKILKTVILNTIPMWIGSSLYILLYLWELYVVGRLGTEFIAAVAVSEAVIMMLWTAIAAISNTSIAMVGNLVGKKDFEGAKEIVSQLVSLSFIVSLFLGLIGYFFANPLLLIVGAKKEIIDKALPYLRCVMLGGTISFPLYVITSILRAAGEIAVPAGIVYGCIILNILLLFPLFFQINFFVELGLVWVALSYVISNGLGTIFAFFFLCSGKSIFRGGLFSSFRCAIPLASTVKEVARLAGLNTAEMVWVNVVSLIMVRLVANSGIAVLAAYEIGQRLLMTTMIWGFDIATVSNILVANNLGAGKVERAEESAWLSCALNVLIVCAFGLFIFLFPAWIVSIFDRTVDVIKNGISYLRVTTPGWPFVAVWVILRRSFIGAKDALTPLLISVLTMGGIQLPLAFFLLKTDIGVAGIWWAIFITSLVQGLASGILFKFGKWKRNV